MGSVIGMADGSGASTATIKYDSFGDVTSAVGASAAIDSTIGTDFRYHGMQLDEVSGLYHVRARTYDARTGRFTSRDPFEGVIGRPETQQPYVFNHNNPHAWTDPSGRFSLGEISIVGAVQGILAATALPAFVGYLALATAQAAIAVCTASLVASAAIEASGGEPPAGPCSTGGDDNFMFHYTATPDGFPTRGGAISNTWWTDEGTLTAATAYFGLGIGKPGSSREPPTHVVITVHDRSNFVKGPPLRVPDQPEMKQWYNLKLIPMSRLSIRPLLF